MRNLTEQLDRIKSLMLIKEQCGSDLTQCERDLEDEGYKVFNPKETERSCDNNNNIKCVKNVLNTLSGNMSVGSAGRTVEDCFVLIKGNHKTSGAPTFYLTFYADGQVVLTFLLNEANESKKLVYRSIYECDGTNIEIKGGFRTFKYVGVSKGSSANWENGIFQKDSGGTTINVTINASESTKMEIPKGNLKYGDTLTYYLNIQGLYKGNVLDHGLTKNKIVEIMQH